MVDVPMTVGWENDERRVIRWVLSGELDWAELDQMMALAETMLDGVSYPVYVLALVEGFHLPSDTPLHFPGVAQKRYWQHPNLAATVVVGADHFFKMMIDIYQQVYDVIGAKIISTQSLDDANQIIADAMQ